MSNDIDSSNTRTNPDENVVDYTDPDFLASNNFAKKGIALLDLGDRAKKLVIDTSSDDIEAIRVFGNSGKKGTDGRETADLLKQIARTNIDEHKTGENLTKFEAKRDIQLRDANGDPSDDLIALVQAALAGEADLGVRSMTLDSIEITVGGRWSTDVICLEGDLIADLLCGDYLDTIADVGDGQSRFSVVSTEGGSGNTIIGASQNSAGFPGGISDLVGGSAKGEADMIALIEAGLNGDDRINVVDIDTESGTALIEITMGSTTDTILIKDLGDALNSLGRNEFVNTGDNRSKETFFNEQIDNRLSFISQGSDDAVLLDGSRWSSLDGNGINTPEEVFEFVTTILAEEKADTADANDIQIIEASFNSLTVTAQSRNSDRDNPGEETVDELTVQGDSVQDAINQFGGLDAVDDLIGG